MRQRRAVGLELIGDAIGAVVRGERGDGDRRRLVVAPGAQQPLDRGGVIVGRHGLERVASDLRLGDRDEAPASAHTSLRRSQARPNGEK